MKRILVTGATGFVGRHVVGRLAHSGYEVVALSRDRRKLETLNGVSQRIEMDIHNAPTDAYQRLGRPDVLIHLAWDGLPNYSSLHHFEKELPGQYAFLKSIIIAGLPYLLVTGTCFEYGMQSGRLREDLPTVPINPYGFAKDTLRKQLQYLQKERGFGLTWCRLFYMYGEDQTSSSLYSQLQAAVEGRQVFFNMSGGEQIRDYLHVETIASHLEMLSMRKKGVGVVNVCSGQPISVRKLVEQWIEENGWKICLNLGYYAYPAYEPLAFWGDATRLKALIEENV